MPPRFESIARVLPRLRNDFETSRHLTARAVERARRLAERAIATRRLLEARLHQPRADRPPNNEIWNAAAQELVRASHERDLQLGIVSHELRQSLTAAVAADRLLSITSDPSAQARARAVLTRQLAHSSALIDNLLDDSRLTAQQIAAPHNSVDVHEIVDQAIETVGASDDPGSGSQLIVRLPREAGDVRL